LKAVFERLWGDEKSWPALLWFLTGATGSRISPGDTPDCPSACHRRCRWSVSDQSVTSSRPACPVTSRGFRHAYWVPPATALSGPEVQYWWCGTPAIALARWAN